MFAICIMFALCLATACEEDVVWRNDARCGVNCAYVLTQLLGKDVEYESVVAALGDDGAGTSVKELIGFFNDNGMDFEAVRCKPEGMSSLNLPFVAYMEPEGGINSVVGHYVIVIKIDEDGEMTTIDGTTCAVVRLPTYQFCRDWSGVVLRHRSEFGLCKQAVMCVAISMVVFFAFNWKTVTKKKGSK